MTKAVKSRRVLVVDDEENILTLLQEVLVDAGYQVDGAADGSDALEKVRNNSFDVMLVDLRLPRMDGMEVLRTAKTLRPHLSVIMMTGDVNLQSVINSIRHGACDFIAKPFNLEETVAAVNRGWVRKELETQSQPHPDNSVKRSLRLKSYRK